MKNNGILLALVLVVIVVGFLAWGKLSKKSAATTSGNETFTLVIKNRKLVSGSSTLNATQGDQVTINVTVDEDVEFHLHGYDKMLELKKNQPGSLTFTADQAGHFPFELEDFKIELGALDVQPK